jgi:hypothetical protein
MTLASLGKSSAFPEDFATPAPHLHERDVMERAARPAPGKETPMFALHAFAGFSLFVGALLPLEPSLEVRSRQRTHTRALNAHDAALVQRVSARAAARLEDARCASLLTDFTDRDGRTLASKLEPLGVSASQYLLQLRFFDGSQQPVCRPRVIMATVRGAPRVFVCPGRVNSRLSQVELESSLLAEAMIIHEMLHALGLGENPPSSFEITARVRESCH